MKQKILRYIAKGVKVFIIDPEDEYSDIVERYGGEVVHLSSNSSTRINPRWVIDNRPTIAIAVQVISQLLGMTDVAVLCKFPYE